VRFAFATAMVLVAAAGVFGQSNTPPITHDYAEVNGVRLHYAKAGAGPLMIFLHGFPEFWYEWKYQLAEFSKDHLVVAPDMRGYNLSSKPTELSAYQMPQLVEDVRALAASLLKTAGRSTFTLVAHDWGGVVAWVFAAQHPEILDKLVIVNAPHPTIFTRELRDSPAQQQASQYMLMFRGPQAEETLSANSYERLTTMVLGAGLESGTVTEEDKAQYLAAWSQSGALTGGLNYYRAAGVGPAQSGEAPTPLTAQPLTVRVPTLVIWGEKDTALLTGNLTGLEQFVPSLTIKRIPDGTHWVVREQPDTVNALIRSFIGSR